MRANADIQRQDNVILYNGSCKRSFRSGFEGTCYIFTPVIQVNRNIKEQQQQQQNNNSNFLKSKRNKIRRDRIYFEMRWRRSFRGLYFLDVLNVNRQQLHLQCSFLYMEQFLIPT